ncbi:helix-turn-helix domain-containing protein [Sandarakinorhabdus sp.]|uniref:helix-turn-helix domain-containing protein n=1 Tax=Sandarakinorhabdus sp. TaxID=1916663 RepID=UPI003F6E4DDF
MTVQPPPVSFALSEYLTSKEVARRLHISPRTLERHRMLGTGCAFSKIGGRVLYRRVDIEAWVERCMRESTSASGTPVQERP